MVTIKNEEFKSLCKALKYYKTMSEKYNKVEYKSEIKALHELKYRVVFMGDDCKSDWDTVQEFRKLNRWVQGTSYINCIQL